MAGVAPSRNMGTRATCGRNPKNRGNRIPMITDRKADPIPINEPSGFDSWGIARKHLKRRGV